MLGAIGCGAEVTQLGATDLGAELGNNRKPPFSLRFFSVSFHFYPPPPFPS
jgi:hypothetical protein